MCLAYENPEKHRRENVQVKSFLITNISKKPKLHSNNNADFYWFSHGFEKGMQVKRWSWLVPACGPFISSTEDTRTTVMLLILILKWTLITFLLLYNVTFNYRCCLSWRLKYAVICKAQNVINSEQASAERQPLWSSPEQEVWTACVEMKHPVTAWRSSMTKNNSCKTEAQCCRIIKRDARSENLL